MADEPPRTFPRGQYTRWLPALGWGTVWYAQSYEVCSRECVKAFPGTSKFFVFFVNVCVERDHGGTYRLTP